MDPKPTYLLINSLSRSGGTFVKCLFDGVDGVMALPVEMASIAGTVVGFISEQQFKELHSAKDFLAATNMALYLERFHSQPYRQCFGRHEKKSGEPDIFFDLHAFGAALEDAYPSLKHVGDAYSWVWKNLLAYVKLDGQPYAYDASANVFVNHFPTNVTPDYGVFAEQAEPICEPLMLWTIRDPYEHVAGLKRHWSRIANEPKFCQMALARWEMNVYLSLRNRVVHPESCDLVIYSPSTDLMRDQFSRSPLAPLKKAAERALTPRVLGLPLSGQSYKEREGLSPAENYDYGKVYTDSEMAYMRSNLDRIYAYLDITAFEDLMEYRTARGRFEALAGLDGDALDWITRRFGEVVDFAASVNLPKV